MEKGQSTPDEIKKQLKEAQRKISGEYPKGKLNPQDEGSLAIAITHEKRIVKIMFPKPVQWIGFSPEQAVEIAQMLIDHAREAGLSGPVTLTLGAKR